MAADDAKTIGDSEVKKEEEPSKGPKSSFPQYDWLEDVSGDKVLDWVRAQNAEALKGNSYYDNDNLPLQLNNSGSIPIEHNSCNIRRKALEELLEYHDTMNSD